MGSFAVLLPKFLGTVMEDWVTSEVPVFNVLHRSD